MKLGEAVYKSQQKDQGQTGKLETQKIKKIAKIKKI